MLVSGMVGIIGMIGISDGRAIEQSQENIESGALKETFV